MESKKINERKVPIVTIDESLKRYKHEEVFPEKLRQANEMLKTTKLPESKPNC